MRETAIWSARETISAPRRTMARMSWGWKTIYKVFNPSYDYPSGCWVPPCGVESCFEDGGDWWWDGNMYGVNAAPTSAGWSLPPGPRSTRSWTKGLTSRATLIRRSTNLNNTINTFLSWAGESIFGTVGGGYDQGGFQPGNWNNGAYGCSTLVPGSSNIHYIHILNNPTNGNQVVIPDGGYQVTSAMDLYSNTPVSFSQGGGNLTLTVPAWCPVWTTIHQADGERAREPEVPHANPVLLRAGRVVGRRLFHLSPIRPRRCRRTSSSIAAWAPLSAD